MTLALNSPPLNGMGVNYETDPKPAAGPTVTAKTSFKAVPPHHNLPLFAGFSYPAGCFTWP
jgi:hypothetical protein